MIFEVMLAERFAVLLLLLLFFGARGWVGMVCGDPKLTYGA